MTVEEAKEMLGVTADKELARLLDRGVTALSNWRRAGHIPAQMEMRTRNLSQSVAGISGHNHQISIGGASLSPDVAMICSMASKWDERKRKKLLRVALELDDTE